MSILYSIIFAIIGTITIGIALREIFKIVDPADISDYKKCKGGWWEAELNSCHLGLNFVPQQPVNTYNKRR